MSYIELAIKIDEDTYNNFVRNEYSRVDVIAMHTALVNGTPQPKIQDYKSKRLQERSNKG